MSSSPIPLTSIATSQPRVPDVVSVHEEKGVSMYSVARFVMSFLVTALVFLGALLLVGQSGRAGGVEVLLILPAAALIGVYTWRRLGPRAEADHRAPADD